MPLHKSRVFAEIPIRFPAPTTLSSTPEDDLSICRVRLIEVPQSLGLVSYGGMQVIRERLGLNALPLCVLSVSPVAQASKGLQVPRAFRLQGPVPASRIVLAESPRRKCVVQSESQRSEARSFALGFLLT